MATPPVLVRTSSYAAAVAGCKATARLCRRIVRINRRMVAGRPLYELQCQARMPRRLTNAYSQLAKAIVRVRLLEEKEAAAGRAVANVG